jgi:hypothetical protein
MRLYLAYVACSACVVRIEIRTDNAIVGVVRTQVREITQSHANNKYFLRFVSLCCALAN